MTHVVAIASTSFGAQPVTEVVILGVSHSGMLVAESCQPAMFRAGYAICIPTCDGNRSRLFYV